MGTDKEYENEVIAMSAKWAADKVKAYDIPVRRLSLDEWLKGQKGFISSDAELESRKKKLFRDELSLEQFFTLIKGKALVKSYKGQAPKWNGRIFLVEQKQRVEGDDVKRARRCWWFNCRWKYTVGSLEVRCKEIQKIAGLTPDGLVGPQTWYAMFGIVEE